MSAANTNFLNSQGRRIVKGAKGAYFVKRADGTKVYGLRAAFRKVGANGAKVKLTKANIASVPSPLLPSLTTTSMPMAMNATSSALKMTTRTKSPFRTTPHPPTTTRARTFLRMAPPMRTKTSRETVWLPYERSMTSRQGQLRQALFWPFRPPARLWTHSAPKTWPSSVVRPVRTFWKPS